MDSISHKRLVALAARKLKSMKCEVVGTELKGYLDEYDMIEVPDVMGWYKWYSYLVECKTSVGDFQRDAKKPFRENPEMGMGDLRYYCVPKGLIQPGEVPEKWGLMWATDSQVKIVKEAQAQKCYAPAERQLLVSILRGVDPGAVKNVSYTTFMMINERLVYICPQGYTSSKCKTCGSRMHTSPCTCEGGWRDEFLCEDCEGRGWNYKCENCDSTPQIQTT